MVLNNDNEDSRKMVEQCYKQSKTVVNPIIDWTDEDVWEFIHEYDVPYCKLYDEGYKRLGCIGCPMGTVEHRNMEFERYPKYKQAYIRAFDRMINERNWGGVLHNLDRRNSDNALVAQTMNTQQRFDYWINGELRRK